MLFQTFFALTGEDTKNPYLILPRKLIIQRNARMETIPRDQAPQIRRDLFSHRAVTQTVRDKTEVEMELRNRTKAKTNSMMEQFPKGLS